MVAVRQINVAHLNTEKEAAVRTLQSSRRVQSIRLAFLRKNNAATILQRAARAKQSSRPTAERVVSQLEQLDTMWAAQYDNGAVPPTPVSRNAVAVRIMYQRHHM